MPLIGQSTAIYNTSKSVLPIAKENIGIVFDKKPTITDANLLRYIDSITKKQIDFNDGIYVETDGVNDTIELPSTTFNSVLFWTKPATTTEALAEVLDESGSEIYNKSSIIVNGTGLFGDETVGLQTGKKFKIDYTVDVAGTGNIGLGANSIFANPALVEIDTSSTGAKSITLQCPDTNTNTRIYIYNGDIANNCELSNFTVKEIPTISLSSDTITTTGFSNETTYTEDKGDWKVVGVTFDELTAPATMAKVGQTYGQAGWFNILKFNKTGGMTQSDFDWLVAHPNATASEIKAQLGISDLNYITCSEGAGDYAVDFGQELGENEIINGSFETSANWSFSNSSYDSANKRVALNNNPGVLGFYQARSGILRKYLIQADKDNDRTLKMYNGSTYVTIMPSGSGTFLGIIEISAIYANFTFDDAGNGWVDNVSAKEIQAATLSGCTWQTGQPDGRHTALDAFNTSEINGETVLLQDVGNGKDVLGNDITITDFMLNVFPGTYGTFTPITISRNAGFIMVDFEFRDYIKDKKWDVLSNGSLDGNEFAYIYVIGDNYYFGFDSNTNGDFWFYKIGLNMEDYKNHKLLLNADSGTIKTYLSTGESDWVLIDTRTPSDDITLSQIINSVTTAQSNMAIRKGGIYLGHTTLNEDLMEILRSM